MNRFIRTRRNAVWVILAASTSIASCVGSIGDPGAGPGGNTIGGDPSCPAVAPDPTTRIVRLTHQQYNNVVGQLLTLAPNATPAADFQVDPTAGGFDNNEDQLLVTGRLGRDYRRSAEDLSAAAVADATAYRNLVSCTPSGDGMACARQFIQSFLRKAYRRPATDSEVTTYLQLFTQAPTLSATAGDAFHQGVQLVVEAALQSPNFLYRVELSQMAGMQGLIALGPFEVASRLALMLWNTIPDDALNAAAEANQLSTPEQIATQAQRMLADPKAHSVVADFHQQWLDVAHYQNVAHDATLFPLYSEALANPEREETLRFVDDVFTNNGGLTSLYTSPYTFVNQQLAPIYGLAGTFGTEFVRADLPATRAGIFTQLGFLASHAYTNSTDPIHRGVFIHRQILCTVIGAPPAGAAMTPLPAVMGSIHTMRERVAQQTSPATCQHCHGFINPVGYALEEFNGIGQAQTMDNGEAVDTTGSVQLDGHAVTYSSAAEMANAIATSDTGRSCYATQWFRYAYQRAETAADRCTINALTTRMHANAYSIRDLMQDLTQTRAFMYRPMDRM